MSHETPVEELRAALVAWDDKRSAVAPLFREDAVWRAARKVAAASQPAADPGRLIEKAEKFLASNQGRYEVDSYAVGLVRELLAALSGDCEICIARGILPSKAIACSLHSEYAIRELEAEIAVLKNTSGASCRLHLALAEMDGAIPSADGEAELRSVRETRARLDRIRSLLKHLLAVANYDDDELASDAVDPQASNQQRPSTRDNSSSVNDLRLSGQPVGEGLTKAGPTP